MKKQQTAGYLLIEALVYAGLLLFAAFLTASLLIPMVTFDKRLQTQVTQTCQIYNALTILRRDLACAPIARNRYSVLSPTEIKYTVQNGTLSWRFDNERLLRFFTYTRSEKVIHDHAVVLESVSGGTFKSLFLQNNILAHTIELSHNAKSFNTTIYSKSLT